MTEPLLIKIGFDYAKVVIHTEIDGKRLLADVVFMFFVDCIPQQQHGHRTLLITGCRCHVAVICIDIVSFRSIGKRILSVESPAGDVRRNVGHRIVKRKIVACRHKLVAGPDEVTHRRTKGIHDRSDQSCGANGAF